MSFPIWTPETLRDLMSYHAANDDQRARFDKINEGFYQASLVVLENVKSGPDQTFIFRQLNLVRMSANQSISAEKDE